MSFFDVDDRPAGSRQLCGECGAAVECEFAGYAWLCLTCWVEASVEHGDIAESAGKQWH